MTLEELKHSYLIDDFRNKITEELDKMEESIRLIDVKFIPNNIHLRDVITPYDGGLFTIDLKNNILVQILIKQIALKVQYRMYLEKLTGEVIYDFD